MNVTPRLYPWMNGRALIFLFVLGALFYGLLFNGRLQYMTRLVHQSNPLELSSPTPDAWFFYTPDRLFRVMGEMGDTGRLVYALSEVSADFAFPVIYALFLFIALSLLLPKAFPNSPRPQGLRWLALFGFLFDYAENCGLFYLLIVYPLKPAAIAWLTGVFTQVKSIIDYGSLIFALALWIYTLVNPARRSAGQRA